MGCKRELGALANKADLVLSSWCMTPNLKGGKGFFAGPTQWSEILLAGCDNAAPGSVKALNRTLEGAGTAPPMDTHTPPLTRSLGHRK
jgi:hypothetical protein